MTIGDIYDLLNLKFLYFCHNLQLFKIGTPPL